MRGGVPRGQLVGRLPWRVRPASRPSSRWAMPPVRRRVRLRLADAAAWTGASAGPAWASRRRGTAGRRRGAAAGAGRTREPRCGAARRRAARGSPELRAAGAQDGAAGAAGEVVDDDPAAAQRRDGVGEAVAVEARPAERAGDGDADDTARRVVRRRERGSEERLAAARQRRAPDRWHSRQMSTKAGEFHFSGPRGTCSPTAVHVGSMRRPGRYARCHRACR